MQLRPLSLWMEVKLMVKKLQRQQFIFREIQYVPQYDVARQGEDLRQDGEPHLLGSTVIGGELHLEEAPQEDDQDHQPHADVTVDPAQVHHVKLRIHTVLDRSLS